MLGAAKKHAVSLDVCGLDCGHAENFARILDAMRKSIEARRHWQPRIHGKRKKKLHTHLDPNHHDGMSDSDFCFHFRMDCGALACLFELLKGHGVFAPTGNREPDVLPCEHRLSALMNTWATKLKSTSKDNSLCLSLCPSLSSQFGKFKTHCNQLLLSGCSCIQQSFAPHQ